jgi:hypothetical protein
MKGESDHSFDLSDKTKNAAAEQRAEWRAALQVALLCVRRQAPTGNQACTSRANIFLSWE